ncbi:amphi-Trp domain-containing protein [Mameliella sediminis]|uniref:amphi-Trp domain-containing protein n=1 Tax=Mameliella sediminis TaxID=2836866 RepID=UPI001C45F76C|nr:amphi-Trp domain-containing protein [Mameliella sediminis]MBY6114423.1 amphi-Trp domain-containing protein [Antarctobacter heliothermus]MBY6143996.1 amphi-Trp domain-containing protein [Mameliella alba]MBV7393096.1 amphi-Trp domain-containing protein [Mameliella sediminis]MBY6161713.1 amphi-Trp domain-containing protein [Mameliella alba]MBY6169821.1 amphi-Trp domain-containing protein [Mameliella alba]
MSENNKRFTHESLQDAKTIKTLLTALSKGFGKGEMTLGDEDDEFVLQTADLMNVRIKGEREDGRCTVSLRVTWDDPATPTTSRKNKPRIES